MPKSLRVNKISVRFSNEELANIKLNILKDKNKNISNKKLTISEYIRRSTIKGYNINLILKNDLEKRLYQFNKIGNNLNQIAFYVNSTQTIDMLVLQKLVYIEQSLNKLLNQK